MVCLIEWIAIAMAMVFPIARTGARTTVAATNFNAPASDRCGPFVAELILMKRRTFLAAGSALLLSACATPPRGSFDATVVPAPQWRVGDSWTFRRTDGYNGVPRGVLTRLVESVDKNGIRFVTRNEVGSVLDEAQFESPGIEISGTLSEDGPVKGVFSPHLRVVDYPLVSGKEWRQSIIRTDANGFRTPMAASVRIEGWEQARAGGKSYRALIVRRNFVLGEKDPFVGSSFSGILHREEVEWYVPELRGAARIQVTEFILTRHAWIPGDRFLYALENFRLA